MKLYRITDLLTQDVAGRMADLRSRNADGSRGRYFHDKLQREAQRNA